MVVGLEMCFFSCHTYLPESEQLRDSDGYYRLCFDAVSSYFKGTQVVKGSPSVKSHERVKREQGLLGFNGPE